MRAGIQSIPTDQRYASLALGLTTYQSYRFVLLPVAFRLVLPPLTSEAMNIIKNSSVAFAVSIAELTMYAIQVQEETARGIEVYLVVTALYFISAFIVNLLSILMSPYEENKGNESYTLPAPESEKPFKTFCGT